MNALATVQVSPSTAIVQWGMTRDQLDLLKRTVADGTTDDEFALFMTTAQRLGLDPFAKQIYAVKRPSWDKRANSYVDKMAIQVGIDGFRSVADRTGQNDGQDGPFWCGDDGEWTDAWLHDNSPAAARVVVYKKGCSKPFTGIATYRSYVQTNKDGKPNRQWEQMPDVMLAKCAEALALRKAFPSQLSGVYAPEEMGQAENDNARREAAIVETDRQLSRGDESDNDITSPIDAFAEECKRAASVDDLKALAPKFNSLKKGTPERKQAHGAYTARMAQLTSGVDAR